MNGNKITVLRDPTSDEDAVTKRYVDAVDGKLSASKTIHNDVDSKLSTLKAEYDVHVGAFGNLRRNRKLDEISDEFFGKTSVVTINLSDIKSPSSREGESDKIFSRKKTLSPSNK